MRLSGRRRHLDQVKIEFPPPLRHEKKVSAIRAPRREVVPLRIAADVFDAGTVGVHDVDLVVAVTHAREGDAFAVGRPGRRP